MQKVKNTIIWLVNLYVKIRPTTNFWTIAKIYFVFLFQQLGAKFEFLPNLFNGISSSLENEVLKYFFKFLASFCALEISNWVLIIVTILFLIMAFLHYQEKKGVNVSEEVLESIQEIKADTSEIKNTQTAGIKNWGVWEKSSSFVTSYIRNAKINEIITQIQSEVIIEKNAIRIVGLSGLGKTRLVYEALKDQETIKPCVLYCDVSQHLASLKQQLEINYNNKRNIIIADNCSFETHKDLIEIISRTDSKLSLITIDFEPQVSGNNKVILVDNKMFIDVTESILNQRYLGYLDSREIKRIANFADGFPQMAVLFAEASLSENGDLSNFLDEDVLKKLVWGRVEKDSEAFMVLKTCSIFLSLGMKEGSESEGKYVAEKICKISWEKFYRACTFFIQRGIIEPRGNRIVVKPPPLAVSLAGAWWKEFPSSEIQTLLEEVTKHNLSQQMCDRLAMLGHIEEAKEVVAKLCGDNGFFRNAEVLNSDLGSRLFRSLVEANPEVTLNVLVHIYAGKPKEFLFKVDKGRRNLIWSLEKLCFNKNTFSLAAKLLLAFAVSENEKWSNNATSQFLQLFRLRLAGTAASLKDRIEIIKFGLSQTDNDYKKICIEAMGRGLIVGGFQRMMGAENRGIEKPFEDNVPFKSEVIEYWDYIVNTLTEIILNNDINKEIAKAELIKGLPSIVKEGESELIISSLNRIIQTNGTNWPEALSNIELILQRGFINDSERDILNDLKVKLTPKDLLGRFSQIIAKPVWELLVKDQDGNYIDKQKIKAEEFAVELIQTDINIDELYPYFYKGELLQGANFGRKLAELITDPYDFTSKSIVALKSITKGERNPEVLGGFFSGLKDRKIIRDLMEVIMKEEEICEYSYYLTRASNPQFEDIVNLFPLFEREKHKAEVFLTFKYGRALDNLNTDEVKIIGKKLAENGIDGKWVALALTSQYCTLNEQKFGEFVPFLKEIISSENLLIFDGKRIIDGYTWQVTNERLLKINYDKIFLATILGHIVEFCSEKSFNYSNDVYLKNLLLSVFDSHFEDAWPIISKGLIDTPYSYLHLKFLLGSQNGNWGNDGVLFRNANGFPIMLAWCKANKSIAAERLIEMVPIEIEIDGKIDWHPLTKSLIDEFGENEAFLSRLGNNMASYGVTGSSVPYLTSIKILLGKLLDHPSLKVREWAAKNVSYYEKLIKEERNLEIERDL